ncbi:MAG: cytochrome c biogenesis heme-transporting ATPase CcmA [Methylococcales bacterium]|mgnify:CR=1 FL=1|jgi:heme exporter protein A|nr:cytochrome c biogenesis heme-transporting ATPase CcmA [Methylococcales bacterium]MBT7408629.1 cytochrome c biogenesis heme-transporting ATPase CcmA [Methylococcales bacterium]
MSVIEGQSLTCIRDDRVLFENLDLTVNSGQVLQIKGKNGSGKTSLLRILSGLTQSYDGEVLWNSQNILHDRSAFFENLLYIAHGHGVKSELTALENLRVFGALAGKSNDQCENALKNIGLYGFENVPSSMLSAGQKRRVSLARLWTIEATLWVLDEPFTAIDKQGIEVLENLMLKHTQCGGMIIITSHQELSLEKIPLNTIELSDV